MSGSPVSGAVGNTVLVDEVTGDLQISFCVCPSCAVATGTGMTVGKASDGVLPGYIQPPELRGSPVLTEGKSSAGLSWP